MATGVLRRGGAAFAATLLAAGVLLVAGPAAATSASSPSAACPQGDGVTVVVDFGTLGGGVQARCVTEPVTSGFDALRKAGFAHDPAQRFRGLLCRIDGKPADDPCVNAPPANRYWAYWTAARPGGAWTYSDQGAGTRTPPPGSVEGWAFSDGCDRKPGAGPCPSAPTTTRPATTTTTRSDTGAGGGGPAPGGSDDPGSTVPGAPADPDDASTSVDRESAADPPTSTSRVGDRAPSPGETGDDEQASAGLDATAASNDADAGSPVGVLVGTAAVLAIAGAGAVTVRRRRAGDDGGA